MIGCCAAGSRSAPPPQPGGCCGGTTITPAPAIAERAHEVANRPSPPVAITQSTVARHHISAVGLRTCPCCRCSHARELLAEALSAPPAARSAPGCGWWRSTANRLVPYAKRPGRGWWRSRARCGGRVRSCSRRQRDPHHCAALAHEDAGSRLVLEHLRLLALTPGCRCAAPWRQRCSRSLSATETSGRLLQFIVRPAASPPVGELPRHPAGDGIRRSPARRSRIVAATDLAVPADERTSWSQALRFSARDLLVHLRRLAGDQCLYSMPCTASRRPEAGQVRQLLGLLEAPAPTSGKARDSGNF